MTREASFANIPTEFTTVEGLEHLAKLLQGKLMTIDDERNFVLRVSNPTAGSSMGHLEHFGTWARDTLKVPRSQRRLDSSAQTSQ